VILGGFIDYAMASNTLTFGTSPELTTSAQATRLGFGARFVFVRTADRLVDLYGAADASFEHRGAETISSSGTMPTQSVSASGFSLAFGPGLRLWVHEKLAIGYAGRLRVTYLTGEFGALDVPPDESTTSASATAVGFDGTFQLLGVF
jgi:hypothetical protein